MFKNQILLFSTSSQTSIFMFSYIFKSFIIIFFTLLAGYSLLNLKNDIQLMQQSRKIPHSISNPVANKKAANNLAIKLIGTLTSTSKMLSSAIISETGMPEKVYRIGDRLASGGQIIDITANSIILSHNGNLQHILLRPG